MKAWWARFKAWAIRKLGGERHFHFPAETPSFLPVDRPFELMDWEELLRMPREKRVFFEWIAHRIRHLDAKATAYPVGPDGDRDRLVYLARRDELMRTLNIATEAGAKLAGFMDKLSRSEQMDAKQKGMKNHGR